MISFRSYKTCNFEIRLFIEISVTYFSGKMMNAWVKIAARVHHGTAKHGKNGKKILAVATLSVFKQLETRYNTSYIQNKFCSELHAPS